MKVPCAFVLQMDVRDPVSVVADELDGIAAACMQVWSGAEQRRVLITQIGDCDEPSARSSANVPLVPQRGSAADAVTVPSAPTDREGAVLAWRGGSSISRRLGGRRAGLSAASDARARSL
jgi:hypothetical protein